MIRLWEYKGARGDDMVHRGGSAETKTGRPTVTAEQEPHLHSVEKVMWLPLLVLIAHQPRAD